MKSRLLQSARTPAAVPVSYPIEIAWHPESRKAASDCPVEIPALAPARFSVGWSIISIHQVAGSIPSQDTYKNQPMKAGIRGATELDVSLSLSLSLS